MIIREAKLTDAEAITKVHVDTWLDTYRGIIPDDYLAKLSYEQRETSWRKILAEASTNNHPIYVVENSENEIIAFADGGRERSGNSIYQAELYAIYILPAYQRKGIGKVLFCKIADDLTRLGFKSLLVWVLADNPACKFYEALGGKIVDRNQIRRENAVLDVVAIGWIDIRQASTLTTAIDY
ncbi:N-acetyltransferase family protein [Myxosarcina sp. GI1(2024)]